MDSDGIDEVFTDQVRMAMMAASQIAATLARRREQLQRQHRDQAGQQGEQDLSRLTAQRQAAIAALAATEAEQWWQHATSEQVAQAYGTAAAWAGTGDPAATAHETRLREGIKARYGIDPAAGLDLQRPAGRVERENLEQVEQQRAQARRDREAGDAVLTEAFIDAAEEVDRAQAGEAGDEVARDRAAAEVADGRREQAHAYDTAERREATAEQMRTAGVAEPQIATRMLADRSQARPATDAVTAAPGSNRSGRPKGGGRSAVRAAQKVPGRQR